MTSPSFTSGLRQFQRRWRIGLIVAGTLRALFWVGLLFAGLGLLDFYSGFSDQARRAIFTGLVTVTSAGVIWALWEAIAFAHRDAASEADRALGSNRREVLSALELEAANPEGESAVAAWLRQQAVESAGRRLAVVPSKQALPLTRLRRQTILCAAFGLGVMVLSILWSEPVSIIARRLMLPDADIPPYSRLHFVLSPNPAEVQYGDPILISAEITRDAIKAPVRCLTRDPATGKVEVTSAFQESPTRFSAKLEKMAAPVDVAFSVDRARSGWLPISVKMQPKVHDVIVKVVPPPYSGLPTREFALGSQELAALPGSKVIAQITSNRPLKGGTLQVQPFAREAKREEIAGSVEDTHRIQLGWTVRQAARLAMQVHDIVGTASAVVEIEQKLLPDERPQAVMRQPAGDVLATPDTELPLEATASDDFGLTRVSFVRQLHGYRERSLGIAVTRGQRQHSVNGALKLASFGVQPGQTIELVLEAGDTNPNLLGTGVSEPARIHIITHEQYAERLRAETTLEEFSARYEALAKAMEEARLAVEALDRAAKADDPAQAEQARKDALAAHESAAKVFGQVAKDFPLFALDDALAKSTVDAMTRLFENAKELEQLEGQAQADLRDALPALKQRLGAVEKQMAENMEQGEKAIAAAKVFEQAARFQELIEQQRDLVKDYNRTVEQIRRGEMQAAQALRDLGQRQQEIAEGMSKMEKAMGEAIEQLPEGFEEMRAAGEEFLQLLAESKIPSTMDEGVRAAERSESKVAGDRAAEALARMEALLRKQNGICQMCRGQGDAKTFPWPEDLSETLKQLMDALIPKPGGGKNGKGEPRTGESGPGMGGSSDSGFSMRGKMARVPLFGPSRSRFSSRSGPASGRGQGNGSGAGGPENGADIDASTFTHESTGKSGADAMVLEAIPEAYREAVKRYFSTEPDQSGERSTPQPETKQP